MQARCRDGEIKIKLAIASDLHLEIADLTISNKDNADVLILAGDILTATDLHDHAAPIEPYTEDELEKLGIRQLRAIQYRDFIKQCSEEFPQVIAIAGNHELYRGRWSASISHLRQEYQKYSNVHFLERDTWEYNDVLFIGGTLWTDMNRGDPVTMHAVNDMMNDYKMIRNDEQGFINLRPTHTVARHRKTLDFFKKVLKENITKKTVVVSHHAPSSISIDARFTRDRLMNGAYYSDLSEVILDNEQIALWICGHTHHSHRYHVGNTLIACNPRGYVGFERASQEQEPFHVKIVDLENMPSASEVMNDYDWSQLLHD